MRTRPRYLPISDAQAGMELAAPLNVMNHGVLRLSLPAGHALTADNLNQLHAHHAEFIFINEPDDRPDEQVAIDAAIAAKRIATIFSGADLSDPNMMALFDQVLMYRSA